MSGIDMMPKKTIKQEFIEQIEQTFKMEKRDNPYKTGKFHEYLLELQYKAFVTNGKLHQDNVGLKAEIRHLQKKLK